MTSPDLRVAHDHRPDLALAVSHRSPGTGPPEVENILHKTDSYYIHEFDLLEAEHNIFKKYSVSIMFLSP